MPLIPPLFVQTPTSPGSTTISGNTTQSITTTFSSSVTAGHLLIAATEGDNFGLNPLFDTLTLNGISDTLGNTWNRIALASFMTGPSPGTAISTAAIWYAFATATGADTVSASWTSTGGTTKNILVRTAEWKNVAVGGFDHLVSNASFSNPATAPSFTTSSNNELLISIWGTNFGPSLAAPWVLLTGATPLPVFTNNVGQPGTVAALSTANPTLLGYYASIAGFFSAAASDPINGNVFLSQYPGMPWMPNVMMLCRQYWDAGLSQPTVGQEFPAPNTGGARSGQTYPY